MEPHDILKIEPSTILKKYEKIVYLVLITIFAVVVAFSIGELVLLVFNDLVVNTPLLLENQELLNIFGYFFLVLIGVELLTTISAYIKENVIHVEVVIIVAIIAITRGVILLEPGKEDPMEMFGTAAIIIVLCAGYYLLKQARVSNP